MNATDTAVELAEKEGVNLEEVTGTGPDGRIYKGDVEDFINAAGVAAEPGEDEPGTDGEAVSDEGEADADASADAEASESTGDESETVDKEGAAQAKRYALRDAAMAYHGVTHEELDGMQPGGDGADAGFVIKDSMVVLYCIDHRILKVRKATLEASDSD